MRRLRLRAAKARRQLQRVGPRPGSGEDYQRRVPERANPAGERFPAAEVDAMVHGLCPATAPLGRLGLRPDRQLPARLVAAHGVDEHQAGHLIRVRARNSRASSPP